MREILFIGKRTKRENEWVEGDLWQPIRNKQKIAFVLRQDSRFEVHPETVGQYTGLKDKNGEKIFEGDIVKCDNTFWQIEWDGKHCAYSVESLSRSYTTIGTMFFSGIVTHGEVIGNIHENPELLKGGE